MNKQHQICSKCNDVLELSKDNFYPSKNSFNGYHHVCRKCSQEEFKHKEDKYQAMMGSLGAVIVSAQKKQGIKSKSTRIAKSIHESGLKSCTKCNQEKSLDSFYTRKNTTSDGYPRYTSWCKECSLKAQQKDNSHE